MTWSKNNNTILLHIKQMNLRNEYVFYIIKSTYSTLRMYFKIF